MSLANNNKIKIVIIVFVVMAKSICTSSAIEKPSYVNKNQSKKDLKLKIATLETRSWLLKNSIYKNKTNTFDIEIDYFKEKYKSLNNNPCLQKGFKSFDKLISSGFGYRVNPITGLNDFHSGVDIKMGSGNPIYSLKKGIVERINQFGSLNAGKFVMVKHHDNDESYYLHLSNISVKEGDEVQKGDLIGYSGSTGRSTGPHLHFSVKKNGRFINPLQLQETRCYIDSY